MKDSKEIMQDYFKFRNESDKVAVYVALGEVTFSELLNEAFQAFEGPDGVRGRYAKAGWLIEHVAMVELDSVVDFEHVRVCQHCGRAMHRGYVVNGCDTYCCDTCLHQHVTEEEYEVLYADGTGDSYFTSWTD